MNTTAHYTQIDGNCAQRHTYRKYSLTLQKVVSRMCIEIGKSLYELWPIRGGVDKSLAL
jgi:hypothetical protein